MLRCAMAAVLVLCGVLHAAHSVGKFDRAHLRVPAGAVVIECERPAYTNFTVDTADPAFVRRSDSGFVSRTFAELSAGAASLLSTRVAPESAYVALYEFVVRKPMRAHVWVFEQGRAWASPFVWRVGTDDWRDAPASLPMEYWVHCANNGPTFAWVRLGEVTVGSGRQRLEIRVTQPRADGRYLLAQDCIVLTVPTDSAEGRPFEYRHEGPGKGAILLWDSLPPHSNPVNDFLPWMEAYLVAGTQPRGAVVICPGGAYVGRAPTEGVNIARRFNKDGLHAFVVYYRTSPHRHPAPLVDAARAVRIVRARAAKWNVKPDKIALCGFSAGGHLAASVGVHFDKWRRVPGDWIDSLSCRPDALILCYPVITAGEFSHRESFRNLLGENPSPDTLRLLSLELQVTERTPPTFLWHTATDDVRVENSLLFASALSKNRIPFEIHVFHEGAHGLNLAEQHPHVGTWVRLCREWLGDMGW